MKIEYYLDKVDLREFLFYSLNFGSQKERRKKTFLRLGFYFIIIISMDAIINGAFHIETFIIVALILVSYFFLLRSKWVMNAQINRMIAKNYKEMFGVKFTVVFENDFFAESSSLGESKNYYTSIKEIANVKNYYFIRLKSAKAYVINKENIPNLQSFDSKMKEISEQYDIKQVEINK